MPWRRNTLLPREGKAIGRQHGVAIATPRAMIDAQKHAGGVDVTYLQRRARGDTRARA